MANMINKAILIAAAMVSTGCAVGMTCENTSGCDPDGINEEEADEEGSLPNYTLPIGGATTGVGGSGSTVSSVTSSSTGVGGGDPVPPQVECQPGLKACGDTCTDVSADVFNCGGCGWACSAGQYCSAGKCTVEATIHVSGDDSTIVYVDGVKIGGNQNWFVASKMNVVLTAGPHVIAIHGKNVVDQMYASNPAGMIAEISFGGVRIATDNSWLSSNNFNAGWMMPNGSLYNPTFSTAYGDIFAPLWWNRDPATFAAKNFPDDSKALWIWSSGWKTDGNVYFRKEFIVN